MFEFSFPFFVRFALLEDFLPLLYGTFQIISFWIYLSILTFFPNLKKMYNLKKIYLFLLGGEKERERNINVCERERHPSVASRLRPDWGAPARWQVS